MRLRKRELLYKGVFGCLRFIFFFLQCVVKMDGTHIKAIDSVGDPPLPIPNREVKPDSADGTANVCGRVGHRHFYRKGHLKRMSFFAYIGVDNLLSWRWRPRFPVAPHAASLSAMLRVTNCCRHRRSCSRSLQNTQADLVFHSLTRNIVGE